MVRCQVFRRARAPRVVVSFAVLGLVMPAARAAAPVVPSERYIVMLDPAVGEPKAVAQEQTGRARGTVENVFGAVKGYTAMLRSNDLDAIRRDPRTRLVVKDNVVRRMDAPLVTQTGAPYGVDRVDQTNLPLNGMFTANHDGAGVTVYVIDSGIRAGHVEFGDRASVGADFVGDGRNGVDCDGHGTHVAGIIGGSTYGVAKKAKLVAVRVLNCNGSGSASKLVAAINWVAEKHVPNSVANISIGGSTSAAIDAAVTAAVGRGLAITVAAGNGNFLGGKNACTVSPARVATPGVMTIGASDSKDARASFSNYGACAGLVRPGHEHQVGLADQQHCGEDGERHVDGGAVHRRRGRPLPRRRPRHATGHPRSGTAGAEPVLRPGQELEHARRAQPRRLYRRPRQPVSAVMAASRRSRVVTSLSRSRSCSPAGSTTPGGAPGTPAAGEGTTAYVVVVRRGRRPTTSSDGCPRRWR